MKPAELIWQYTELVRQKEEALGHPAEDGPRRRDMAFLLKGFQWLDTADENQPPTEIHALMELIANVRDAWVDPQNDPIGRELFPLLSEMHCALGKEMDRVVPAAVESRQRLENLRDSSWRELILALQKVSVAVRNQGKSNGFSKKGIH